MGERKGPPVRDPRPDPPAPPLPRAAGGGLSLVPSCPSCVCAWCAAGWPGQQGSRWRQHVAGRPHPSGTPGAYPRPPRCQPARAAGGGTKSVGLRAAAEKSEFVGRGSERAERGGWEWGSGLVRADADSNRRGGGPEGLSRGWGELPGNGLGASLPARDAEGVCARGYIMRNGCRKPALCLGGSEGVGTAAEVIAGSGDPASERARTLQG